MADAQNSRSKPYVTFRLLCHASRVGAIIGKSGVLIKTLQEATGATIRIQDAPPDSPDRVILVRASAAVEGGAEVSQAQDALLKVFHRVLDVAAETAGTEVGHRVVSCRLLAHAAQVGAVIGKAGNVVQKIRIDTGCKIRVLNDSLPACTAPSDEIIEIEGQLTSVKKALVAVSHRLQDCPPLERTMTRSRQHEVVQSGTYPVPLESLNNLHIDHHMQRSSTLSASSNRPNGNAFGSHKLSAEVNRVSALHPKELQQEVTFRILCSNDRVGAVIGKGGSIVRALQNESGAIISVGPSIVECEDRLVTITASENPESKYSPAQKAVVLVFSKSVEVVGGEKWLDVGSKTESYVTARLVVPSNQVGCLLGKGGAIVSEMRKATGANIRIIGNDQVPKCVSDVDQLVQISGEYSSVQGAIYNATGRLRDYFFYSTQNSGGVRSLSSVLAGGQPTVAVSHSLNRYSSPGLQAPQPMAGLNSRGTNGVSRELTSQKGGLELVSGSKTAIVTNTTVQIVVPDDVFGSVYGENGSNLARLKQISGAMVIVHEPCPGTSDRTIIISGTPDETQAAQSLLQAFILNGSS